MKNNITVSVGIPAYNEGANIKHLLNAVLKQDTRGFILKEILVISDGSTDDTVRFAQSVKDKRISVIAGKKRLGKSARLQTLFETFRGDVLFLMDADIAITDKKLMSKIVSTTNLKKAGLVSVNITPLPAVSHFESTVEVGVKVMRDIAGTWRNGNNYLPYIGRFLVIHKDLVKQSFMPSEVVSNDAYLYFNAIDKGYNPTYNDDVSVYYRSPGKLADHHKQSSRYQLTREEMAKYFQLDWDYHFSIPANILIASTYKAFIKQPIRLVEYIGISLITKVTKQTNITSAWTIAITTKEIISYG